MKVHHPIYISQQITEKIVIYINCN